MSDTPSIPTPRALPWQRREDHPKSFHDGERLFVAVPLAGGSYDFDVIVVACDTETFEMNAVDGRAWGWSWDDVEFWMPCVVGAMATPAAPDAPGDARAPARDIIKAYAQPYTLRPEPGVKSETMAETYHRAVRETCGALLKRVDASPAPAVGDGEVAEIKAKLAEAEGENARLRDAFEEALPLAQSGAKQLDEAHAEIDQLRDAIGWALGENGDFPPREDGQGAYWWRKELRRRAFVGTPAAPAGDAPAGMGEQR